MKEENQLIIRQDKMRETLLAKYDPKSHHVLVPSHVVTVPSDEMEVEINLVPISPDPADKMVFSFSELGQGMVGLAKPAIEALANAAMIDIEKVEVLAFKPAEYACVAVTGSVRLPNGQRITHTALGELDVASYVEENEKNLRRRIEENREKKCKRTRGMSDEDWEKRVEEYVGKKVTKFRLQLQKFLMRRADTAGRLRLFQTFLPGLKRAYHINELKRPFVVPRISSTPARFKDEGIAEAFHARAKRDLSDLFENDLDKLSKEELKARVRKIERTLGLMANDVESLKILEDGEGGEVIEGEMREIEQEPEPEPKPKPKPEPKPEPKPKTRKKKEEARPAGPGVVKEWLLAGAEAYKGRDGDAIITGGQSRQLEALGKLLASRVAVQKDTIFDLFNGLWGEGPIKRRNYHVVVRWLCVTDKKGELTKAEDGTFRLSEHGPSEFGKIIMEMTSRER